MIIDMAFFEVFTWFEWLLVFLIFVFLLLIFRNVYKLMKRRNEYVSYKEAKVQYAKEQDDSDYEKKAVAALFENYENERK
jgi:hypothetical protein